MTAPVTRSTIDLPPESRVAAGLTCTISTVRSLDCRGTWLRATTTGRGMSQVRSLRRPEQCQRHSQHPPAEPPRLSVGPILRRVSKATRSCAALTAEVEMTQYLEGWVFPSLWYTFTCVSQLLIGGWTPALCRVRRDELVAPLSLCSSPTSASKPWLPAPFQRVPIKDIFFFAHRQVFHSDVGADCAIHHG